ncbi:MAG: nuclear transport factor 2 family protein [Pyrinomonadaceae bacterium]
MIVIENGRANYGRADYRKNHLVSKMKEIENTKYASSDVKIKIDGKTAWATFKYMIFGDSNGKHFDGELGTAILEKRDGSWKIARRHSSAPRRLRRKPISCSLSQDENRAKISQNHRSNVKTKS